MHGPASAQLWHIDYGLHRQARAGMLGEGAYRAEENLLILQTPNNKHGTKGFTGILDQLATNEGRGGLSIGNVEEFLEVIALLRRPATWAAVQSAS